MKYATTILAALSAMALASEVEIKESLFLQEDFADFVLIETVDTPVIVNGADDPFGMNSLQYNELLAGIPYGLIHDLDTPGLAVCKNAAIPDIKKGLDAVVKIKTSGDSSIEGLKELSEVIADIPNVVATCESADYTVDKQSISA
jgi:hypothetical protein